MSEPDYYGFDTLWKLMENSIESKSEVLILFVHWYLTKNGFLNVGVGDDKTLKDSDERSELLPEGWNANRDSYALRYAYDGQLFILHGNLSNGTMIVNLLCIKTVLVSVVAFRLDETVRAYRGNNLNALIANVGTQLSRLKNEMIQEVVADSTKNSETQTEAESPTSTLRMQAARQICSQQGIDRRPSGLEVGSAYDVGYADLNPLGVLGGGMLLPPGHRPHDVRPRIRWDRIGPGPGMGFRGPNPDHMRPPGNPDYDMFM
ncbi:proteasome inhibitor PI31 subunit [Anopheles aquasalis]|uniref:proteasome inhibitor PI31 subunit n=1 Tax=Anopheles aquasalis TaxID=42839 RepID=UPI00215B2EE3|nr:proteasome inhibitor PI31 subunit [Anopheles aquasalis]